MSIVQIDCKQIQLNQIYRFSISSFLVCSFRKWNCITHTEHEEEAQWQAIIQTFIAANILFGKEINGAEKAREERERRIETNVWNFHCTSLCGPKMKYLCSVLHINHHHFDFAMHWRRAKISRMKRKYEINNIKTHTPSKTSTRTESTNYIVYYTRHGHGLVMHQM